MYLQNELCFEPFVFQRIEHIQHRDLDNIRAGALQRHIHCRALAELPDIVVCGVDLSYIALSARKSRNIAVLFGKIHIGLHVILHRAVSCKIIVYILPCRLYRDIQIFSQPEIAYAVDDAEIDGLGL